MDKFCLKYFRHFRNEQTMDIPHFSLNKMAVTTNKRQTKLLVLKNVEK